MSTPNRPHDDPVSRAPAEPVVQIRFLLDDGDEIPLVDGVRIRPHRWEDAREAAIRAVAELVPDLAAVDDAGRRSPFLRAQVVGPRGSEPVVVDASGRVYSPAGATLVAPPPTRGGGPTVPRARTAGPPVGAEPAPQIHAPETRAPEPRAQATRTRGSAAPPAGATGVRAGRFDRRRLAVLLATLLVLATVGAVLLTAWRERGAAPDGAATPLPVAPPAGWAGAVRWQSPPLSPAAGPALAVGDALAFVEADHTVSLVDFATGRARWRVPLAPDEVVGPLAAATVDRHASLVVPVGSGLRWFSLDGGRPSGHVVLPAGARVSVAGGTPLVELPGTRAGLVLDGRLSTLSLPAGATAVAARPEGSVTATSAAGWWHLRPDTPGGPRQPWPGGSPARATPVGYADGRLLYWLPGGSDAPRLRVYTDRPDGVRLDFESALTASSAPPSWRPAPTGTWGLLGVDLVDLRARSVTRLGPWTTRWVSSDRAYGSDGRRTLAAGPGLARGPVPDTGAFPEVITAAGAAIRVAAAGVETIYVVPPLP